ncbi:hypothetical protein QOZ80_7AG0574490 [Eleusine coracana subsp. coracana]|nr:hypothetical protein QOZ80_7AG0574490 [Eleusine coracana subsp. coracana]
MAAAVTSSNDTHRSAIVRSNGRIVPLRCASSRVRISVNPARVVNPARGQGGREAEQRYHRSRDEEKPSPVVRRRRHDENARDASPDRKRRRESGVYDYYRDVKRGSSSTCRRDRDYDAYYNRGAKRPESDERKDTTRKSVSSGGSSRPEQRARTTTRPRGAAVDGDRKPTPEVEPVGENAAQVKRRLDIQQQREQARREMDQMVKTVEFNDPFISPLDVFKPLREMT